MVEKLGKMTVLLVDDETQFSETLAQRLEVRDFEVKTASSGEEALAQITDKDFDVVILDVLMPGLGGVETLKKIKTTKPLTEVIMLTGHASVSTAIEGMKLGAYDYLIKPTQLEDLAVKIRNAYNRKAEHEERISKAEIDHLVERKGW